MFVAYNTLCNLIKYASLKSLGTIKSRSWYNNTGTVQQYLKCQPLLGTDTYLPLKYIVYYAHPDRTRTATYCHGWKLATFNSEAPLAGYANYQVDPWNEWNTIMLYFLVSLVPSPLLICVAGAGHETACMVDIIWVNSRLYNRGQSPGNSLAPTSWNFVFMHARC